MSFSSYYYERIGVFLARDLIRPFPRSARGYQYVFVVCNYFSEYTSFFPLRTATAPTIVSMLEEQIFYYFVFPKLSNVIMGINSKVKSSTIYSKDMMSKFTITPFTILNQTSPIPIEYSKL